MSAAAYQIVTFADAPFRGNPAFVVALERALPAPMLSEICAQLHEDVLAVVDSRWRRDHAPLCDALRLASWCGSLDARGGLGGAQPDLPRRNGAVLSPRRRRRSQRQAEGRPDRRRLADHAVCRHARRPSSCSEVSGAGRRGPSPRISGRSRSSPRRRRCGT